MRAAVYLRLSRDSAESTSIARQREACSAVVRSRWGDVPVDFFEDVDISGYKDVARPSFDRLLSQIDAYDALVVYRIDRLTRRGARHLLELVEDRLNPAGCALISATEPVDMTGPFGELFLVLLSVFAKLESQRLGERSTAAKAYLRAGGKWTGGPVPYGYRLVRDDDGARLEVDEDAAETVRRVVRRMLRGEPLYRIRAEIMGGPATYQGWRHLLTNPAIAGYQTLRKKIVFDDDGQPMQPWEPIVDPALWRQIQPMFNRWKRPASARTLLGGTLVCGVCNERTMFGHRLTQRSGAVYRRYRCPSRTCVNSIPMDETDLFVLGVVDALLPDLLEQGRRASDSPADGAERGRLESVLSYLEEQMDALLFEERRDPSDPAVRRVEQRIHRTRTEMEALDDSREGGRTRALEAALDGRSLTELDVPGQRRVLELVTAKLTVLPGSRGNPFDPARVVVDVAE